MANQLFQINVASHIATSRQLLVHVRQNYPTDTPTAVEMWKYATTHGFLIPHMANPASGFYARTFFRGLEGLRHDRGR